MSAQKTLTDSELVLLLQRGDSTAFTAIYNSYWEFAYRTAFNVLKDEETCMDVVQDVFVWLWKNHAKLNIANLQAYLRTAVKFKMLNAIRNGKMHESALQHFSTEVSYYDTAFEVKELKEMIDSFVDELPAQAKRIFHLSRNENLSNKEIAQQMNLSEKTVKNQLYISLKKLKASLGNLSSWGPLL